MYLDKFRHLSFMKFLKKFSRAKVTTDTKYGTSKSLMPCKH